VAAWIIIASLLAALFSGATARTLARHRPDPELSGLPRTPLERLGWIGLAASGTVGVGLAILVAIGGAEGFYDESWYRGVFWLLLMTGIVVWFGAWFVTKRRYGGVVIDERDRAVLARSLSVESMLVLFSLVVWTIALTEAFADEGAIPLGYLQLLFWSTLIAGAFGRSAGVVLGYRRGIAVDA